MIVGVLSVIWGRDTCPPTAQTVGAVAATAALLPSPAHAARGGEPAATDSYRFTARIDVGPGKTGCTGSLVETDWVLTAASCATSCWRCSPAASPTSLRSSSGARPHTARFAIGTVASVGFSVNGQDGADTCKGDAGGPALRTIGDTMEFIGISDQSWQCGCFAAATAKKAAAAANRAYGKYLEAKRIETGSCVHMYAGGPALKVEEFLNGTNADWAERCVRNVIAKPEETGRRAYTNTSLCAVYNQGSEFYNNCIHNVLDPMFEANQKLTMLTAGIQVINAILEPLAV